MSRPQKKGIDYFSLDVNMDDKIAIIEATYGVVGFGVVIKLFQKIYSEGYYYNWTEKEQLLFSKSISVDIETVESIVLDCIKWGLFDKGLFGKYQILTSTGIQKRYIAAIYKRTEIEMNINYLLINVNDKKNIVLTNVSDIGNHVLHVVNDSESTQSKEKKSKLNKEEEEANVFKFYEDNGFGILSPHVRDLINNWINDGMDESIILLALQIAVINDARKWNYVDTLLLDWHNKNFKTVEEVQTHIKQFQANKQSRERGQPNKLIKKEKVPDYILHQEERHQYNKNSESKTDIEKMDKINRLLKNLGEKHD